MLDFFWKNPCIALFLISLKLQNLAMLGQSQGCFININFYATLIILLT
jgi:hypothetical protein